MKILFLTFFATDNLGVRSLAAWLERHGHTVHILQIKAWEQAPTVNTAIPIPDWAMFINGALYATTTTITNHEFMLMRRALAHVAPDIVGISAVSLFDSFMPECLGHVRDVLPKAHIVSGGVGPSLNPMLYLKSGSDAVICGEGEHALLQFVQAIEQGRDWKKGGNLCFLHDGALQNTPMLPLEKNLGQFPLPIFEDEQHFSWINRNTYKRFERLPDGEYRIMASRGCIGKCSYCATPRMRKFYDGVCHSHIRNRPLEQVLAECEHAKKTGHNFIRFIDSFFIRPATEMANFFDRYEAGIKLPFSMYLHPQQLLAHEELIDKAVSAGLSIVPFGLQHACAEFCRKFYKRKPLCNDYSTLIKAFNKRGVSVNFSIIGGNPLESEEDFQKNLDFFAQWPRSPARKPTVEVHSILLYDIPGSALVEEYPEVKRQSEGFSKWLYQSLLLELRQMTSDEQFAAIAANQYYVDNLQALLHLRYIIARDVHIDYLHEQGLRLQGKKVYFYGCGYVYQTQKHRFLGTKPQAILVDTENRPQTVDGIPVVHPNSIQNTECLPVVIFIRKESVAVTLRKFYKQHKQFDEIIICTNV